MKSFTTLSLLHTKNEFVPNNFPITFFMLFITENFPLNFFNHFTCKIYFFTILSTKFIIFSYWCHPLR